MATKITEQDIIDINELYLQIGTYAGVSRELGFSPATIKKYVINDYKPASQVKTKEFDKNSLPSFNPKEFEDVEDFGDLCELSDGEVTLVEELWKEMLL